MPMTMNIAETASAQGIEIRVAKSVPEVEALREFWSASLIHRDSDIDCFLMVLESYPEVIRPHVICLTEDGEPKAILVGRLERKQLSFRIGYLHVARIWVNCLNFVYGAIHGDSSPEATERLFREVEASLKRAEADICIFELVREDSPLYNLVTKSSNWLIRNKPVLQGRKVLVIPDSINDIFGMMSSQRRNDFRRKIKKLHSNAFGVVKIVCYKSPDDLDVLFRDAEEIAKLTYQRGLGAGFSDSREVRMRLGLAARKGWLRAYVLYLDDKPSAFWIGTYYNQDFLSEYLGYNPALRQLSVGSVLTMNVIERFCSRSDGDYVRHLDYGPGDAEYKELLSNVHWQEANLYVFSPSFKGILLKTLRISTSAIDQTLRRLLAKAGILGKVKRAWRDRLAKGNAGQRNNTEAD